MEENEKKLLFLALKTIENIFLFLTYRKNVRKAFKKTPPFFHHPLQQEKISLQIEISASFLLIVGTPFKFYDFLETSILPPIVYKFRKM